MRSALSFPRLCFPVHFNYCSRSRSFFLTHITLLSFKLLLLLCILRLPCVLTYFKIEKLLLYELINFLFSSSTSVMLFRVQHVSERESDKYVREIASWREHEQKFLLSLLNINGFYYFKFEKTQRITGGKHL
jgi:hypothetical protein